MSAPGWQYDPRRHAHVLVAGAFVARVATGRSGTACSLVARVTHEDSPRGSSAAELTLVGWYDEVGDVEQHKARAEAEIRRLATEALAALPARPSPEVEAEMADAIAAHGERAGLHDHARRWREMAAGWRKLAGGAS